MASSLVHHKERIEDRISELPDAVFCHILSFLTTLEAVQTSVLSHRWENVWASVPTLHLDEEEFYEHIIISRDEYDLRYFEEFVDRVLFIRGQANIQRFHLNVPHRLMSPSRCNAWISTAIRHNVVELALSVGNDLHPHYEIPVELFTCNTLMSLKLWLRTNVCFMIPSSNCFPSLKFLHVEVTFPDSDSLEKLFSCCPALEHLIIVGQLEDAAAYNINISGPKLKRLQIKFIVDKYAMFSGGLAHNFVNYGCQFFVSVDAPILEEVDITYDFLVSYSLKNAKCLRKAKIGFLHVKDLEYRDYYLGLSDRIRQLFADIYNVEYLTVAAPIFVALDIRYQSCLLTLSNLNHVELQLQTCRCVQSLTSLLKMSPNLEYLKIVSANKRRVYGNVYTVFCYCDDDSEDALEHGSDEPESVPVCLISHLKTVCLWEFKGCRNEVEMANYLVKHGKALNNVTLYNRFCQDKEIAIQSPSTLWSTFSKFPRGSKTCKIQFQTII